MRSRSNDLARRLALLLFVAVFSGSASSYSVLTHEQVVDLMWKDQIQPLLQKRFPGATEEDLRKAHAYAYGGCVLQDMGYYPFGNKFFSDLVHYVRSGDFVEALLQDASDLNEYAFALGALSHYASDNSGHPTINRVVALEFPKLRKIWRQRNVRQRSQGPYPDRVRLRYGSGSQEPLHLRPLSRHDWL